MIKNITFTLPKTHIPISPLPPQSPIPKKEEKADAGALSGEIQKIKDKYQELIDGLASSKPEITLPKYEPEKMTYTGATDEEIAKSGADSLVEYYLKSINSINSTTSAQQKSKLNDRERALENAKDQQQYIEQVYAALKDAAEKDAVKRGIARSSIISGQKHAYDSDMASNLIKLSEDTYKEIARIDSDIDELEAEKTKALNDFDIVYAAKLAIEIENRRTERDEKAEAVQKYNNQLEKEAAEYEINRQKSEQSLIKGEIDIKNADSETAKKYSELISERDDETYNYVKNYLSGLTAAQRKSLYSDPEFISAVGESQLAKLKSAFGD